MSEVFSLFVKDFTHLDGAIMDPIRGPVGISYIMGIEFIGKLNDEGVVFDFSYAKKLAKKVIDSTADHALVVGKNDITIIEDDVQLTTSDVMYKAPKQAFYIIDSATDLCLFSTLEQAILLECKKAKECQGITCVKLHPKLEPTTEENKYFYSYTHGLKQHYGNCQRLIHGHRSTVNIYVDGNKRPDLERIISEYFHDKHLTYNQNSYDALCHTVGYVSSQGHFVASFFQPSMVIYMPLETTVENISKYIAHYITQHVRNYNKIDVYAYEGIDKGCKYSLTDNNVDQNLMTFLFNGKQEFLKG